MNESNNLSYVQLSLANLIFLGYGWQPLEPCLLKVSCIYGIDRNPFVLHVLYHLVLSVQRLSILLDPHPTVKNDLPSLKMSCVYPRGTGNSLGASLAAQRLVAAKSSKSELLESSEVELPGRRHSCAF